LFRKNIHLLLQVQILNLNSLPIQRLAPGEKHPPIKTQARAATVLPNFVGLVFQVHNGKHYIDVAITEDMVGHKLGEFAAYGLPFGPEGPVGLTVSELGNDSRISRARTNR
jgi:ribosomal protein S19